MPACAREHGELSRRSGRRIVQRDAADRIDARRAAAGQHANVGASADHRDLFQVLRPKRQQSVAILQEDDAAFRDALRDGKASRAVYRLHGFRAVERSDRNEAAQDATRHVVDSLFGDFAFFDGGLQRAREVAFLPELLVEARVGGLRGAVGRAPIGHDPALEAPLGLQDVVEEMRVLAGVDAVHLVVGAHHAADARLLHGDLEGQQVDLAHRPFIDAHVDPVAIGLLGIRHEVLDGRNDTLGLDPANLRRHQAARQDRILAEVLEVASVPGVPFHVGAAGKQHVEAPIRAPRGP